MTNTIKAAVLAVVSDGLALAVSFGVSISTVQQAAILGFVGSVTTVLVGIVAWHENHKTAAATQVATAQMYAPAVDAAVAPLPVPPAVPPAVPLTPPAA